MLNILERSWFISLFAPFPAYFMTARYRAPKEPNSSYHSQFPFPITEFCEPDIGVTVQSQVAHSFSPALADPNSASVAFYCSSFAALLTSDGAHIFAFTIASAVTLVKRVKKSRG